MTTEQALHNILQEIRRQREKMNFTQEALAAQLGYGQNAYSKMELGLTELRLGVYLDICRLLHLDAAQLIWAAVR